MIKSMTGFGKATCELPNKKIIAEIKSLNSKSPNIIVRLPEIYREKELEIRSTVTSKLERGKIELFLKIESEESQKRVSLNKSVINNYYDILQEITNAKAHSVHDEQIFQIIMRLPDVLKVEHDEFDPEEWKKVFETIKEAVNKLDNFRIEEGKSLENDLKTNILAIENLLTKVVPFEENRIEILKEKLTKRLDEVFDKSNQDKNRFEQEIIYYIEKFDINEEKVRLKNHCEYFISTMKEKDALGKKLGFISQEIGREINTLGSKANHVEIQKIVVQMKDHLEKIKEQTLNIL